MPCKCTLQPHEYGPDEREPKEPTGANQCKASVASPHELTTIDVQVGAGDES